MRNLISIAVFVAINCTVFAQAPRFESLKIFKNRKDVEINTIFQDSLGYLWIGTKSGLVQYDGFDFVPYQADFNLANSNVSAAINDAEGNIWFGHDNGSITINKGGDFTLFDPEEGLGNRKVSSFYIDNNDILWFSTLGEGVYYFKGKNRKRLFNLSSDDGLLDNYVYDIVQDSANNFYLATDKGISVYNLEEKKFIAQITMANGLPDNIVKQLDIIENTLWIGMEDAGVCSYNLTTKQFDRIVEWDFGSINDFSVISNNEIWISTKRKGVVKLQINGNVNSFSVYNKTNGLADTRTKNIICDNEGNLWIGTKKGLSVRRNNYIEFYNKESGFTATQIFGITTDANDNLWVASQDGLFFVSKNDQGKLQLERLLNQSDYSNATFISIFTDAMGYVWAGTYGMGVFKINPETFEITRYTTDEGLCNNNIIHITGNKESIWLATLGGGVSVYNFSNNTFDNYSSQQGLPSNYVYYTYLQNNNTAWIATDGGGVAKITNKTVEKVSLPLMDSIGKVIYTIAGNLDSIIWFNTAGNGLIRFDGNNCHHITEVEHLISNSIQGLAVNNNNELVLSSNMGIGQINCKNQTQRNTGEEEGVAQLNPNLNAMYKDSAGNIYIGTTNGIIKLISHSSESIVKPKLYLTTIQLFDNEIDQSKVKFKYSENYLTFDYRGLWYSSSQDIVYRFTLVGYDLGWRDETTSRSFTYSNLPSGEYTFKVEMKTSEGKWFGVASENYVFTIKPPFWRTPVFIISVILLLLVLIYAYINWRERKLKQDKELLEKEVIKRTAEIRQQKDEIEGQRDEIEAQRNHVTEQRDKIEIQNKEIKSSITYASRIQRAVLPPKQSFDELLKQYFIFFKPRDIVSGDFYYLNTRHNKVIVAAADCTGHGIPGAFMSILGISLLNQIVGHLKEDFNAAIMLNELRAHIKASLRQKGESGEAKDGMDISLAVIDYDNNKLSFAGAYNPLFIVRENELIQYKGDKMPIGVHIIEKESFTNHEIEIQKDDMLYMYSDGFQDQFGGEHMRKFLPKRLRALLMENANKPLSEQEVNLDKAFTAWKGNQNQVDDIIVLGIRI